MITRLLISALLAGTATLASAQDAPILMATASESSFLMTQPLDLERHTSKVAEFRLQEISDELGEKLDRVIKLRLEEALSAPRVSAAD